MIHTIRSALRPMLAAGLLAAGLWTGAPAQAQVQVQVQAQTAAADCTDAVDLLPQHLYGLWQLHVWPEGASEGAAGSTRGVLLFERHPDYPGSVRGEVRLTVDGQDRTALVSGDVTDGVFNLDESDDGVTMSAVWTGDPLACGREIRGERRPAEGRPSGEVVLRFRLTRSAGW